MVFGAQLRVGLPKGTRQGSIGDAQVQEVGAKVDPRFGTDTTQDPHGFSEGPLKIMHEFKALSQPKA